jgi:hypothetical protein
MNENVGDAITRLYQSKSGLVDVKFLHKNLDEGSATQVQEDLVRIQKAIAEGKTRKLVLGTVRLKKVD